MQKWLMKFILAEEKKKTIINNIKFLLYHNQI